MKKFENFWKLLEIFKFFKILKRASFPTKNSSRKSARHLPMSRARHILTIFFRDSTNDARPTRARHFPSKIGPANPCVFYPSRARVKFAQIRVFYPRLIFAASVPNLKMALWKTTAQESEKGTGGALQQSRNLVLEKKQHPHVRQSTRKITRPAIHSEFQILECITSLLEQSTPLIATVNIC